MIDALIGIEQPLTTNGIISHITKWLFIFPSITCGLVCKAAWFERKCKANIIWIVFLLSFSWHNRYVLATRSCRVYSRLQSTRSFARTCYSLRMYVLRLGGWFYQKSALQHCLFFSLPIRQLRKRPVVFDSSCRFVLPTMLLLVSAGHGHGCPLNKKTTNLQKINVIYMFIGTSAERTDANK